MSNITTDSLLEMGFKKMPHFTVMNSLTYELKSKHNKTRFISVGVPNTPNEAVFIGEKDPLNPKIITDLICISNYDFDGHMSNERMKLLIKSLTSDYTK